MIPLRQCMGGWCRRREVCGHHRAPEQPGVAPAERLCEKGRDNPLRADAERMRADPRFAGWAAGEPA